MKQLELIPKRLIDNNNSKTRRRPTTKRLSIRNIQRLIILLTLMGGSFFTITNLSYQTRSRKLLSFRDGMLNAIKVKEWRQKVVSTCKSAKTAEDMLHVRKISRDFTKPLHEHDSRGITDLMPENWIQRCPFVFLDLGTGVGDAIGEFIDAGMVGCRRTLDDAYSFSPVHFDVDTGNFVDIPGTRKGERNEDFTTWVKARIEKFYSGLGPEDYCVYGVEPNPLLKNDLIKLERHLTRMDPRPLRHLHFLTETAIHAEQDIKKTIYIDSIHNKEKYPGSSLFQDHKNVRENVLKFKDTFKYDINSMTLSSLMNQTMSFFAEDKYVETKKGNNVNGNDKNSTTTTSEVVEELDELLRHKTMEALSRQHLIMYIDVEGSEFNVLNEAVSSGLLCNFVNNTNNVVDIYIEYHSPDVMGKVTPSAKKFVEEVRPFLLSSECGGDNLHLEEIMKYFGEGEEVSEK